MKKKTYKRTRTDAEPIGKLTRVPDFLPPPAALLVAEDKIKITIAIDKETLDFFKTQSKKNGVKYQKMIREVLKMYALKYGA